MFEKLNPGCGQIVEIPNGVDMEYFKPQSSNNTPAANSPEIIFTGAMDYHANIDGVSWFYEKIWPRILKVIPNARFTIVGSNPSPVIKKMDKRWGSFVSNKKIILNPKLIQAPEYCIDYVITHELCHLKRKRHDAKFYKLLELKIPNWEKVKEKLEIKLLADGRV